MKEQQNYTEVFQDDRGQLWGFAPGAVMATPIPEPPPEPLTWRSLIKLTAKVAWEEVKAFRPGAPELCALVFLGGAIVAGSGAGEILDGLIKIVIMPYGLIQILNFAKQDSVKIWRFKLLSFQTRQIAILALLWQWAIIFGSEPWLTRLIAPVLGLSYMIGCMFILIKIAYFFF